MIKKIFFTSLIIFGILIVPKQVFAVTTFSKVDPEDAKRIVDTLRKDNVDTLSLEFPDGVTRDCFFVYYPGLKLPESLTGVTRYGINFDVFDFGEFPAGVTHRFEIKNLQQFYPYFVFSEYSSDSDSYVRDLRYMINFLKTSDVVVMDDLVGVNYYNLVVRHNYNSIDSFPIKSIYFRNVYMDNSTALFFDGTSENDESSVHDFTSDVIGDYYRIGNATNIISSNIDLKKSSNGESFIDYNKVDFSDSIKGDSFGGLGGINSVTDIVKKIPELIGDLVASFSLVGLLFTTLLGSFPPIVTVGLYSVFTIGIIILLIKVMT